ncbi:hypothetical protein [Cellulosilyticum ruminicola]|uniref:hypothetical protein n=1 Tax=Cellulosilyticum ruminicola TaxID=425254 RepID=UPI0006D10FE6|nr:hypothetical protein [Cellulosilyticum ruminicola]
MPVKTFDTLNIDDIRITEKGLSILASYPDIEGIIDLWPELYLIDTRTHEKYMSDTHINWDKEAELNKKSFVFEEITVTDLLQIRYNPEGNVQDMNLINIEDVEAININGKVIKVS